MPNGLNSSCLQKPRQQTFGRNPAFPRPHFYFGPGKYDPDNPAATFIDKKGKTAARREPAYKLRIFMAEEEAKIDTKMHPQSPIEGIISG